MAYQTILFDLDGTLLDTLEDLVDSVNHILERHRCPQRTLDEVRLFVGNGLGMLMRRSLPAQYSQTVSDLLAEELRTYYTAHSRIKTAPYAGVRELLETLHAAGAKVAVVSNKADEAVGELCSFYFPGLVDAAVGETAGRRPKPAPDAVELALERLHADKTDSLAALRRCDLGLPRQGGSGEGRRGDPGRQRGGALPAAPGVRASRRAVPLGDGFYHTKKKDSTPLRPLQAGGAD